MTIVAGNGSLGYTGDGGPATQAQLDSDFGLALDLSGNLYIIDSGNGSIRKVDSSGTITTVAGDGLNGFSGDGGPAVNAQLNLPEGIAFDAAGNMYIADKLNCRVRKVDTSGIISTVAGTGVRGFGGDGGPATSALLSVPAGVGVDAAGNLYIADRGASRVRKVDTSGVIFRPGRLRRVHC